MAESVFFLSWSIAPPPLLTHHGGKPRKVPNHPYAQMLGMHGTVFANFAVDQSDLLLAFGVRFDDRVTGKLETFASNAKIVHIDIDPAELNKNKESFITVTGKA